MPVHYLDVEPERGLLIVVHVSGAVDAAAEVIGLALAHRERVAALVPRLLQLKQQLHLTRHQPAMDGAVLWVMLSFGIHQARLNKLCEKTL